VAQVVETKVLYTCLLKGGCRFVENKSAKKIKNPQNNKEMHLFGQKLVFLDKKLG